jgi:hypothetical protein
MIIRGLVHIDASILLQTRVAWKKKSGSRGRAHNPPFAVKLQRMGHPVFVLGVPAAGI